MVYPSFRTMLVAVALIATGASARAATTGTLVLSGTIGQVCSIAVAPQGIASALDLNIAQTALVVASITETSNDNAGYKVNLNTANGTSTGIFKGTAGNTDTLAYTVLYNGVTETFVGGNVQVTNVTTRTPTGGVVKPVALTYGAGAGLNSDTYTDTLTVTLTAN